MWMIRKSSRSSDCNIPKNENKNQPITFHEEPRSKKDKKTKPTWEFIQNKKRIKVSQLKPGKKKKRNPVRKTPQTLQIIILQTPWTNDHIPSYASSHNGAKAFMLRPRQELSDDQAGFFNSKGDIFLRHFIFVWFGMWKCRKRAGYLQVFIEGKMKMAMEICVENSWGSKWKMFGGQYKSHMDMRISLSSTQGTFERVSI